MSPSNKNCYVNNVDENHKTSQVIYSKIGHQLLQYAEYILGMAMWDAHFNNNHNSGIKCLLTC